MSRFFWVANVLFRLSCNSPYMVERYEMQKILKISLIAALGVVAVFVALSFAFISWNDCGSENYAGGLILRDAAGEVMRVSLGEGDVDCRA